uniref:Uncharacterized protein n=1 Tax=Chromera velia CCMP2878 TaxID=1169474 RepID=A0A0G4F7D9_9ALVE|eukprot:Cvel_15497.t1-p1 / transcript=Cvel_15497.t1 / gene=Cvel_15497 / organism=Chromera_velia_CCMP2878 / gene_product=hypothetical protein / transcript_product=hypothetical protein / location=Cvel_scaffold1150:11882-12632(-) / protein_length=71 / sequence_SO=supercontig / SO=protein_coding / is_pseudo=false
MAPKAVAKKKSPAKPKAKASPKPKAVESLKKRVPCGEEGPYRLPSMCTPETSHRVWRDDRLPCRLGIIESH